MAGAAPFDVAVVGLGAMGAATLYQLAKAGVRAVGIDRYAPPHGFGSSHGETRITRQAVGEGDALAPLVIRSHAIWRELEATTGEALLEACGILVMVPRGARTGHHGQGDFLARTIAVARRHGIPHAVLDAAEIAGRFPGFALTGTEAGYFEPGGGYVRPERCIAAQLAEAARHGAEIRTGAAVIAVAQRGATVAVETRDGTIEAGQVVVAAGAWAGPLLGAPYDRLLRPFRQVLHWFPVADAARPPGIPAFIWMHGARPEDYFYGFPPLGGAVKVATEQYEAPCDPDRLDRVVAPGDAAAMHLGHVAGRLRGLGPTALRSEACLYTVTPDSGFVIERHPAQDRVIVVSACSGHGFKHSAGIGEAVADLVRTGRSPVDLAPFASSRFALPDGAFP